MRETRYWQEYLLDYFQIFEVTAPNERIIFLLTNEAEIYTNEIRLNMNNAPKNLHKRISLDMIVCYSDKYGR
jgi:hypothetical protein